MKFSKKLMLVELNEFSTDLFKRAVKEVSLPNVERLLALREYKSTTDDKVEHRGLDPWVQWVSVHTGVPSSEHHVIHLGDAPAKLGFKQIWEKLSEVGVSSGIWGAMNATKGAAERCKFFLPDPWTFSEPAYPEKINDLLALPRYYSKNYLDVSRWTFFVATLRLVKYVLSSGAIGRLFGTIPLVMGHVLRHGVNNAALFSLFDLFSTILFLQKKREFNPDFSLIFLNSIAHLQHHKWRVDNGLPSDVVFGLRVIDRVLGMLFSARGQGEELIVMNALTQKNIANDQPRICYRQINPERFLQAVGIGFLSVEQLMTNDAHVFFASQQDRDQAAQILGAVKFQGEGFFHIELSKENSCKLFYQVDFWDEVIGDASLLINGRALVFSDHFEAIVARTGAHVQDGNIFSDDIEFNSVVHNHEVGQVILDRFLKGRVLGVGHH